MSQRVGTLKDHELWLRCPECGDSQNNPNKGHLSVNILKAVFYCVRCGHSGVLSVQQALQIAARFDIEVGNETTAEPKEIEENAGSTRYSCLKRWHHMDTDWNTWDVFEIRDPTHNEVVGQYFRLGQASLISGESGLGYCGSTLISSANSPLRLVEGPYDVLGPQDVCCYGFLRTQALKLLRGHFVTLCPDGDVWQDELLRARFVKVMQWCFRDSRSPEIVGLEMIPDGKDPDECHPTDRLFVPRHKLLRKINTTNKYDLGRYLS
jgi:hypothetical protein